MYSITFFFFLVSDVVSNEELTKLFPSYSAGYSSTFFSTIVVFITLPFLDTIVVLGCSSFYSSTIVSSSDYNPASFKLAAFGSLNLAYLCEITFLILFFKVAAY
jgi:hypothetical protein